MPRKLVRQSAKSFEPEWFKYILLVRFSGFYIQTWPAGYIAHSSSSSRSVSNISIIDSVVPGNLYDRSDLLIHDKAQRALHRHYPSILSEFSKCLMSLYTAFTESNARRCLLLFRYLVGCGHPNVYFKRLYRYAVPITYRHGACRFLPRYLPIQAVLGGSFSH